MFSQSLESSYGEEVVLIGTAVSQHYFLKKLAGGGIGVVHKAREICIDRFVVPYSTSKNLNFFFEEGVTL